jgi:alanine racemase
MSDNSFGAIPSQLRLRLDAAALTENYKSLCAASGKARTGAAVKADGYGLGARDVTKRLSAAGCQDFFVAHWAEASEIAAIVPAQQISVLCGVNDADMRFALALGALPMLNSPEQIQRWKAAGGGRCNVMIDSGINRLGIMPEDAKPSLFEGLEIDILASHLASADEDVPQNFKQLGVFGALAATISASRYSLANSAGIMLGSDYHFDLTRPGLSLYGGIPRPELASTIKQVAYLQSSVLQVRNCKAGDAIGYNATYICKADTRVATCSLGYADGYLRGFSGTGRAQFGGVILPLIGRVSMDLITLDVSSAPDLSEGDWVDIEYTLPVAARQSGLSQYELLTGLGARFDRIWSDIT